MKAAELSLIWKHSRIYGLANILNRLAGLLLLPVYLHVLSPAEFGLLALVTLTMDLLGVVLGLGLGRALLRFYVGATSDVERDELVVTALTLLLALAAVFAGLALPAADIACRLIFASDEHVAVFFHSNLATIFTVLFSFELSCLLASKSSLTYLWASLAKTVVMLTANIFLVVYADLGVMGIVLGNLLSSVLISGLLLIWILRGRALRFARRPAREMVAFAIPFIPSVLLDTIVAALDKLSINHLAAAATVGFYSTGQRLSDLLQMFLVQPFMQIWAVRELEVLDRGLPEDQANLARVFDLFLLVLCAGALFVSLFAVEIIGIIASAEFGEASRVVPVLALAQICIALRSYYEVGIFQANATRYLPGIALAVLVLAVPTYGVLVSWLALEGAAVAFLLMAAARAALVARVSLRVSSIGRDLRWGATLTTLGAAILTFIAANEAISTHGTVTAYAVKSAVVAAYTVVIFYSPAIGAEGRSAVFGLVSSSLRASPVAPPASAQTGRRRT